jgi:pullulanase/glycogen debranching enzyme
VILKNNFLQGYPAPLFGGEKNVAKQHGCRDRFDQSQKISWFDFQGLSKV